MAGTEFFIHIGCHRTGTTFLQSRIFPAIEANCIMIPDVHYLAESPDYDPRRFLESLRSEYGPQPCDKTIISQETLSGRADGNPMWDTSLIADRLSQTFPQGKVLIVIRNQLDYVLSLYAFRVVNRGLERRTLRDYLEGNLERLGHKLRYDGLVQHYLRLFGKESVLVLPYEQLRDDHRGFIERILAFMQVRTGLDYESSRMNESPRNTRLIRMHRACNYPLSLATETLRNRGLLAEGAYVRVANGYFWFKRRLLNVLLTKLAGAGGESLAFDEQFRGVLLETFRDSNHRLADLIEVDLASYGYPW